MALVSDPPPPPAPKDSDDPSFPWYAPFAVGLSLYVALGVVVAGIAAAAGWGDLRDRLILEATGGQGVLLIAGPYLLAAVSAPRPLYRLGVRRFRATRGLAYAALAFFGFFL